MDDPSDPSASVDAVIAEALAALARARSRLSGDAPIALEAPTSTLGRRVARALDAYRRAAGAES